MFVGSERGSVAHLQNAGLPEEQARPLFQQLAVAVDYIHRMGIANRDIKLDNVLLHRHVRETLKSQNSETLLCAP